MTSQETAQTFQRALSLIKVERVFEAIPLLDQVIAAEPTWAQAYVQRARVRKRLGDRERAIADYAKAINLAPTAEIYLARALLWLELDQLKGAIADSRQAIALQPDNAGAHRLLGKALGKLGDGPGAIAAYKQAARQYLDQRDKENAQRCLDAIAPLKSLPPLPKAAEPASLLGPTDKTATPEDYLQRVQQKYDAGQYAAALSDLNWLLGVHPQLAKALCLRGLIQARTGKRSEAVADLALAAQLHPEDSAEGNEVRFYRGKMRQILNDGYGAIEEFSALIEAASAQQRAAVSDPADIQIDDWSDSPNADSPIAKYFAERGHSYRLMNEPEQAFKDYSNAIALETDNASLYEYRAEVQKGTGSVDGAIADYQQAATLWLNAGNWQAHQRVVEDVRSLRKGSAAVKQGSAGATVSIKTYKNHLPVLEVMLDGIAKFDMVIDRNAPNSIITQRMANQLNLTTVSYQYVYLADGTPMELSIARLRSVVIGGTIITDVYVAIAPDNATVVLGKDCFSAYSIRISGNDITFTRR
ncbi:MAG: tetratricopeptide repeat protein [Cyanobacteria bacterium J06606_4]